MNEEAINLVLILITFTVMIVGTFIYCNSPDLHNCGSCGKFLNIKDKRFWYKVNGKEVPFCNSCHKKQDKN